MVALGFEPEAAKAALRKHKNDVQSAVDELIKYNGVLPYSTDESSSSSSGSGELSVIIIFFIHVVYNIVDVPLSSWLLLFFSTKAFFFFIHSL